MFERPARLAARLAIFAVGAAGTYLFAAAGAPDERAYAVAIPVRALAFGLVGIIAGTVAALGSVDPERSGFGLFLALGGVVAGMIALTLVFPERDYLSIAVIVYYGAPLAIGYLVAAAIADAHATPGP